MICEYDGCKALAVRTMVVERKVCDDDPVITHVCDRHRNYSLFVMFGIEEFRGMK